MERSADARHLFLVSLRDDPRVARRADLAWLLRNVLAYRPRGERLAGGAVSGRSGYMLVKRVPVLSEKAAAEFLDLAPGTLRNLRSRGNGPVYSKLPNGRVKYRIDQLERWRDGNTRSSTTEAAAQ